MPKKPQSHVTYVDSKIQNTDGMEELVNVLLQAPTVTLSMKAYNVHINTSLLFISTNFTRFSVYFVLFYCVILTHFSVKFALPKTAKDVSYLVNVRPWYSVRFVLHVYRISEVVKK